MSPTRIALIAEDRRFLDFLVPAIDRTAADRGCAILWSGRELVHGCRPRMLLQLVEDSMQEADLIVIGADATGPGHARKGGHRRKRRDMQDLIGSRRVPVVFAIADPSVEAWLICDPDAFARGLESAVGSRFRKPGEWPVPTTEREAKGQLGRLVADGIGDHLPRGGFEFAAQIVPRVALTSSSNQSLSDWAREFSNTLAASAR